MEPAVDDCPVPTEQQPINEYQQLKESWLFSWGMLEMQGYIGKLACVWLWSWLIAAPVSAASFAPGKYPGQFVLCGAGISSIFVGLAVLRLYLGWSYVRSRLQSQQVVYEESGWYDVQTWTKTPEILTRDRLLVTYQVQPILLRLWRTLGFLILSAFGGGIIWSFL